MDRHAIYVYRNATNDDFPIDFAIFTKALRTDGPTDQPTDRPTDQRTDIPSYRDAIAASKNNEIKVIVNCSLGRFLERSMPDRDSGARRRVHGQGDGSKASRPDFAQDLVLVRV